MPWQIYEEEYSDEESEDLERPSHKSQTRMSKGLIPSSACPIPPENDCKDDSTLHLALDAGETTHTP